MRDLTLDRDGSAFFTTKKVGRTREFTPEGYLLCRDVCIARTGEMLYAEGEVPIEPGRDGIVRVSRLAEDLFRPESIASYNGKTVTLDHPDEDVNPDNWRELAVGIVLNPRRGEGSDLDYLVADLLITEKRGIDALGGEEGNEQWEVSCGYDADYEQFGPGRGRQFNFIGNHVALVDKGRCGPTCAIGDADMTTRDNRRTRRSWKDRIRSAFKARDEEALTEAMQMAEDEITNGVEGGEEGASEAVSGPSEHRLVIEVKPAAEASSAVESQEGQAEETTDEEEAPGWFSKARAEDKAWRDGIEERIGKLEGGGATDEASEEEGEAERSETGDEEAEEKEEGEERTSDEEAEEGGERRESAQDRRRTGDSASFKDAFQDMISRAEILSPGIKLPTFDGKADRKITRDRMCAFKRRALSAALDDAETAEILAPLVKKTGLSKLTCDSVGLVFAGGSELVKRARADIGGSHYVHDGDRGAAAAPSISDLNERNRKFWREKGGAL
jgi:hypothetical protein